MRGGVRNLPDSSPESSPDSSPDSSSESLAQLRYNCSLDSSLREPGSRGVTPLAVDERAAEACANFLRSKWSARGGVQLAKGQRLKGFKTYEKTIDKHSSLKQRQHTLIIAGARIAQCRKRLPGFDTMVTAATEFLKERCSADAPPKLFHVHALRQSPAALGSSSFCVHQDTVSCCLDSLQPTTCACAGADHVHDPARRRRSLPSSATASSSS